MPVTMPGLFAYASMAVHLTLISMGILILLSRKPSDLFQFVPFRFYLIFMFLCFSSPFSPQFFCFLFLFFLSINFSSPFLVMRIFLMKLSLHLTYNYPLIVTWDFLIIALFFSVLYNFLFDFITGMFQHTCIWWYLSWLRTRCVPSKSVMWTRTKLRHLFE